MLAQLQRADVGDDGPAIFGLDLRRVVGHGAETVRHHVEEVSDRHEPQAIDVQRRRRAIAAAHDHAVAGAGPAVARRAKDVVALLAARHHRLVDGERKHRRIRAVDLAVVEQRVVVQLAARDCAGHGSAGRTAVGEERRFAQRDVLRLVVHVLPAAGHRDTENTEHQEPQRHGVTEIRLTGSASSAPQSGARASKRRRNAKPLTVPSALRFDVARRPSRPATQAGDEALGPLCASVPLWSNSR